MLDAEQNFLLSRPDQFLVGWPSPGSPHGPRGRPVSADRVDQPPHANSPDERGYVAVASVPARLAPYGEKSVLQGLIDGVSLAAAAAHPGQQPASMPFVEASKRSLIAARYTAQQRDIIGFSAH